MERRIAMNLNKVLIGGRVGTIDLKYSKSGSAILNMSVVSNKKWNDKSTGNLQEKASWHRIVVYGKQAENCSQFLKKGSQVYLEGELNYGEYEKDGIKRYTTDIVASNVQFLGGKKETSEQQAQSDIPALNNFVNQAKQEFTASDVPF
jgi:single-strand DNA-binding protein